MAKNENFMRGSLPEPDKRNSEIIGILLMIGGLISFLALVSYNPRDLPVAGMLRSFTSASQAISPRHNFIGPVGALLGAMQIILLGGAGYLVPIALLWFGVAKLFFNARLWARTVLGFAILILSAAALLQITDIFFLSWKKNYLIPGPGGLLGKGLGTYVFAMLLGKTGSTLLLTTLYFIALIMITGLPPLQFLRACYILLRKKARNRIDSKNAEKLASQRDAEKLAERDAEKERRRRERQATNGDDSAGKARPLFQPSPADAQQFLPLSTTPPPKIIDASTRRSTAPQPGDKPFERKPKTDLTLSTTGFENYELPGFDLLDIDDTADAPEADKEELLAIQKNIIETLKSFGIDVSPGDITRGPTITRYEIYPSIGLRVSRIAQLEADLARATCAERINILAPIPGKDTVGIEIANTNKVAVPLRELLQDPEFRSAKKKIPLALGKDVYVKTVIGDLAAMPHLLVAGATGSGKSVCINSIIASILFKFGPDELRFIMVDPKVVEMQIYNKLPHLVVPVVTDPKKTVAALKWVVNEMEKRYRIFAKVGVRNFDGYNNRVRVDKT